MKRAFFFILLVSLGNLIVVIAQSPYYNQEIENKISKIIEKLTLEEKIGQMCQLTVDMVTDSKTKCSLDEALLDTVIGKYKVGSLLNVVYGVAQKKEVWADVIEQIQKKSMKELGIPCIYGVDEIHGASYTQDAIYFPQGINMAATFNRDLVRRCAEITAYETRASSVAWTFAPVMDLGRDARWARMWESYGEDSYLNAEMGTQAVLGLQGENPNQIDEYHIAACIKHYMGYGVPITGKDRTPSSIMEKDMREKYFAPFLQTVRHGALTLMPNSSTNSGIPFHANKKYLTDWLKDDLQWDGVIISDWGDIYHLYDRDRIAATKKEAIKMAINAGVDMSMVASEFSFCIYLKELVEEGEIPMSRIDDAVRRILRLKFRLGLFEHPYWNIEKYNKFDSKKFAQVALYAAEESEILLKNEDNILPLANGTKILVTGPNSNSMRCLNGGWSYSWQGDRTDEFAGRYNTIYEAISLKYGAQNVTYEPGIMYMPFKDDNWWEENIPEIEKAVQAAKDVDVIIACIGENSYCETPGNLEDLNLSKNQKQLIKELYATGKPIVLILNQGRPRIIQDIEPLAKAVVHIMLPGNYGGDALANLLSGESNFSGRLPFTYPRYINSLVTYDYKPCEKMNTMPGVYNYSAEVNVLWPFGFGLSYTNYQYSNFRVNKSRFTATDELTFTIDITNVGSKKGTESILLYSTDLIATVSPDVKRLRDFAKIELNPGETKTVSFELNASKLAFVGHDNRWRLEKGDFQMMCGSESLFIQCTENKIWEAPNIN